MNNRHLGFCGLFVTPTRTVGFGSLPEQPSRTSSPSDRILLCPASSLDLAFDDFVIRACSSMWRSILGLEAVEVSHEILGSGRRGNDTTMIKSEHVFNRPRTIRMTLVSGFKSLLAAMTLLTSPFRGLKQPRQVQCSRSKT